MERIRRIDVMELGSGGTWQRNEWFHLDTRYLSYYKYNGILLFSFRLFQLTDKIMNLQSPQGECISIPYYVGPGRME